MVKVISIYKNYCCQYRELCQQNFTNCLCSVVSTIAYYLVVFCPSFKNCKTSSIKIRLLPDFNIALVTDYLKQRNKQLVYKKYKFKNINTFVGLSVGCFDNFMFQFKCLNKPQSLI